MHRSLSFFTVTSFAAISSSDPVFQLTFVWVGTVVDALAALAGLAAISAEDIAHNGAEPRAVQLVVRFTFFRGYNRGRMLRSDPMLLKSFHAMLKSGFP